MNHISPSVIYWFCSTIIVFLLLVFLQLYLFRINGFNTSKIVLWRIFISGGNVTAYYNSLLLLKNYRFPYQKFMCRLYVCAKQKEDVMKIATALVKLDQQGEIPTIMKAKKLILHESGE